MPQERWRRISRRSSGGRRLDDPGIRNAKWSLGVEEPETAARILGESRKRNEVFFDAESDKRDRWADDLKENLERELKNLELEIREAKKARRMAQDLESKIAAQKRINELEQQRNHRKRMLFDAQDDIEQKKDALIAEVESRLRQDVSRQEIFTIRWRLR